MKTSETIVRTWMPTTRAILADEDQMRALIAKTTEIAMRSLRRSERRHKARRPKRPA